MITEEKLKCFAYLLCSWLQCDRTAIWFNWITQNLIQQISFTIENRKLDYRIVPLIFGIRYRAFMGEEKKTSSKFKKFITSRGKKIVLCLKIERKTRKDVNGKRKILQRGKFVFCWVIGGWARCCCCWRYGIFIEWTCAEQCRKVYLF